MAIIQALGYSIALAAGFFAGLLNTVAGGGPILTLMALSLAGLDPRIANLTSTVALMPGQILSGVRGWRLALRGQRFARSMLGLAAVGGGVGAMLLVVTPSQAFHVLVPWLVLIATLIYVVSPSGDAATGRLSKAGRLSTLSLMLVPLLGVYGGYFGGGNSFLMLAVLGWSSLAGKTANEAKNALIAAVNLAASFIFVAAGEVAWSFAIALAIGNLAGSWVAMRLLDRISARLIRAIVIALGLVFSGSLFWQLYAR